jgi:hypothetical protein
MRFGAILSGNLRASMQQEVKDTARALRAAVDTAAKQVQGRLREQARAGGFKDGGRSVANAWRMKVYPRTAGRSLRPAAIISSNMPNVVDAFERGAKVTAKGGKYLAIPTGFNMPQGRRRSRAGGQASRVSTADMVRAKGQAFILRSKSNPRVALWCLRTSEAQSRSRSGRITRQVIAANRMQVGTGRGTVAGLRPNAGRAQLLKQGFVPMFILVREVQHKKRLDVAGVRRDAAGMLASAVAAEFARMPAVVGMAR